MAFSKLRLEFNTVQCVEVLRVVLSSFIISQDRGVVSRCMGKDEEEPGTLNGAPQLLRAIFRPNGRVKLSEISLIMSLIYAIHSLS